MKTDSNGGYVVYYAADGTLARLTAIPHGGPICARAITWLPVSYVTVTFQVS